MLTIRLVTVDERSVGGYGRGAPLEVTSQG